MRRFFSFLIVLALAGGALYATAEFAPCKLPPQVLAKLGKSAACPAPVETAAAPAPRVIEPPAVSIVAATRREFVDRLFVSGTLTAREEAQVVARVDGLSIVAVLAEDGDRVTVGQTLARLDRTQLDALLAQNDASTKRSDAAIEQSRYFITQSEAQVAFASADYERAQKLGGGVMSISSVEQRETAMKTAQAQLAAARSALNVAEADRKSRDAERQELQVRIARTNVASPVAGLVSRRSAKLGAISASAGEPLFRIIVDGAVDLDAEAPEDTLHRLAPGMPALVKLPGLTAPVAAHVRLVNQEVDKSSRTGKARIALDDPSQAHIGAFASAEIDVTRRDGVGVPASAIKRDGERAEVLVVKDGKVEQRAVTVGIVDGERVEVREGIAEGETVVARAAAFLRSGDRVRAMIQTAMVGG